MNSIHLWSSRSEAGRHERTSPVSSGLGRIRSRRPGGVQLGGWMPAPAGGSSRQEIDELRQRIADLERLVNARPEQKPGPARKRGKSRF